MSRPAKVFRTPFGRVVPVRQATGAGLGAALRPGVIVETDLATAQQWGAFREECADELEAIEASDDPATFGVDRESTDGT